MCRFNLAMEGNLKKKKEQVRMVNRPDPCDPTWPDLCWGPVGPDQH